MARDVYEDRDEVVARSDTLGSALVFITFALLVAGLFFAQQVLKRHYNAGMLAEPTAPSSGGGT